MHAAVAHHEVGHARMRVLKPSQFCVAFWPCRAASDSVEGPLTCGQSDMSAFKGTFVVAVEPFILYNEAWSVRSGNCSPSMIVLLSPSVIRLSLQPTGISA